METEKRNSIYKKTEANSVVIKLWLDIKRSTINRYFAFVVN
jgi:hypothetical protein